MLTEVQVLNMLDYAEERAREFAHVYASVIENEGGMQGRDCPPMTEWQVCSLLSAFINFMGERERVRYGSFVCDLETRNNELKGRDSIVIRDRMRLFSARADEGAASAPDEMTTTLNKFMSNDADLKAHLQQQPDIYEAGIDQDAMREWFIRLRVMLETECSLISDWNEAVPKPPHP